MSPTKKAVSVLINGTAEKISVPAYVTIEAASPPLSILQTPSRSFSFALAIAKKQIPDNTLPNTIITSIRLEKAPSVSIIFYFQSSTLMLFLVFLNCLVFLVLTIYHLLFSIYRFLPFTIHHLPVLLTIYHLPVFPIFRF